MRTDEPDCERNFWKTPQTMNELIMLTPLLTLCGEQEKLKLLLHNGFAQSFFFVFCFFSTISLSGKNKIYNKC